MARDAVKTKESAEAARSAREEAPARRRAIRLKTRLWLTFTALLVLVAGVLIVLSAARFRSAIYGSTRSEGASVARSIATLSTNSLLYYNYLDLERIASEASDGQSVLYVVVYDRENEVAATSRRFQDFLSSAALPPSDGLAAAGGSGGEEAGIVISEREGGLAGSPTPFFDITVPVLAGSTGETWGHVRVGYSLERQVREVWKTGIILLATSAGALALGVGTAFLLSRRITRPVEELLRATVRVAEGHGAERIAVRSADEVGELAHNFNVMIDEVQRRKGALERQVAAEARSRQRLSVILRTIVDGIIVTDASHGIVLMNPAASRLLGLGEVEPGSDSTRLELRDGRILPLLDKTIEQSAYGLERDVQFVDPASGREKTIAIRTAAITASGRGPALGVVATLQDVTQLRAVERYKSELIANVSHELRTPLAIVKLSASNLKRFPNLDEGKRRQLLESIEKECNRLENMIRDLLDMSRIEAGCLSLHLAPNDVREVAADVASALRTRAEEKEIVIAGVLSSSPVVVRGDKTRLGQVMTNLVVNAINYTPPGGRVEIRVSAVADPRDRRRAPEEFALRPLSGAVAEIVVADSGTGIPRENLTRIFERFFRGKSESMNVPGTGLGLSIVKEIVESHGGVVFADSVEGAGSEFVVHLPLAPAPARRDESPEGRIPEAMA